MQVVGVVEMGTLPLVLRSSVALAVLVAEGTVVAELLI